MKGKRKDQLPLTPQPEEPEGKAPPTRSDITLQRRRFIHETLAQRHELPMSRILKEFPGTASQSLKDDIEHLTKLGLPIIKKREGREIILVDDSNTHQDVKHIRAGVRTAEKNLLAKIAAGLIAGYPESGNTPDLARLSESIYAANRDVEITSPKAIRTLLERCARLHSSCRASVDRIHRCLEDLWAESNRLIFLDSGTTNDHIADKLAELPIPTPFSNLSRLTVATNDSSIFSKIGNPRCPIASIVVGGQKRGRTDTIAGALAENFLRQANLHFGVCIVGAAIVDMGFNNCCSDTQEEASLKAILFQMSSLRVVCVDNSKFVTRPMRTGFPFAALNPLQIDLIITNCPRTLEALAKEKPTAHEIELQKLARTQFPGMMRTIIKRGVPVLMAESIETDSIDNLFE